MFQSSLSGPRPIPASPHLKNSFVLQMVQDQDRVGGKQQWPPTRVIPGAPRPHDFLSKCASEGGKRVAWPPHLSSQEDLSTDEEGLPHAPSSRTHPQRQNDGGPNLTTTYPSGFKLRDEVPLDNTEGIQVVPSQPAFKITQPVRVTGDQKWPPKKGQDITQEEVREFIKPKKTNRDYTEFFAQNALPNQYPSYRVPPGTQHRGGSQE